MQASFSKLYIILACTAFFSCAASRPGLERSTSNDPKVISIEDHRIKTHQEFLSEKSPLLPADKKKFNGLKYYPIDLAYSVPAKFIRNGNPVLFKMKTTTIRQPDYQKFADVIFSLQGQEFKLEVYQSPDLMKKEGFEDYLFIPFTDETNGTETYDVGRYLEVHIPAGDTIELDFNKSYNPYCSYNPNYSCPIPPASNHLSIAVKAGEKKFKDSH